MIAANTLRRLLAFAFLLLSLLMVSLQAVAQTSPAPAPVLGKDDQSSPTARPPPPEPGDDPPYNNALYVRQSVPTTMVTNGLYNVSVTLQNYGTTTWESAAGHVLGSQSPQDNWTWGNARIPLGVSVPPGETVTIDFQVRAPSTAGSYGYQWRMVQGAQWFGSYTPALAITVRDPINNAQPWAQSVPTQMEVGQRYDVSVSVYNNGESTWTRVQNYTLMSQGPHNNMTWGLNRVALPFESIAPDNGVTFTFQVTAPSTPGAYVFQWGMQREGYGSFGPSTAPVTVNVVAPPPLVNNAQVVGITVPERMVTGKSYNVAVTMQNTGATTWSPGANYRLGSQNPHDNFIWGMHRVDLASAVAPGQSYTFSFPVTAPAIGSYAMQWGMVQDGVEWFGGSVSSPVTVLENLGNVTYLHTDGLGSPVARTDAVGNLVSRTRYEPYGGVASGAAPTIGFTGHVNDADTGLTYMQQRYYDPVAGRFLSIDPVTTDASTGASFNRYSYANNNSYRYIDPDGRMSAQICADMGGNCTNYGGSAATEPSNSISSSAKVGAVAGGIAGGMLALGCDVVSSGTCVPANLGIVSGGIAAGAVAGGAAGEMFHSGTGALKKAVTAATGYIKPKYWSTHHIVAQNDGRAAASQAILLNAGMGINDGNNGIFMHSMYHDRIHTTVYHAAVTNALQGATSYMDVALRLNVIRVQINLGVFPW